MNIQTMLRFTSWMLFLIIVFMTLGPLQDRPTIGYPQAERFVAFLVLSMVCSFAYPKHRGWVVLGISAAAILLEVGQLFVPRRDAAVADAVAKLAGGLFGVFIASAAAWVHARTRSSMD